MTPSVRIFSPVWKQTITIFFWIYLLQFSKVERPRHEIKTEKILTQPQNFKIFTPYVGACVCVQKVITIRNYNNNPDQSVFSVHHPLLLFTIHIRYVHCCVSLHAKGNQLFFLGPLLWVVQEFGTSRQEQRRITLFLPSLHSYMKSCWATFVFKNTNIQTIVAICTHFRVLSKAK